MKRTKARLKINQILTGKKTNLRVVGCLLFREWDEKKSSSITGKSGKLLD